MLSKSIERTRSLHEDLETLERMVVREFKKAANTHWEKIEQSSRVECILDKMQTITREIKGIYQDCDGSRKHEIDLLGGCTPENNNHVLFYSRLKKIMNFYKPSHLSEELIEIESEVAEVPVEFIKPNFSGEEGAGRYLDLHLLHAKFINSKFGTKCKYIDYINEKAWSLHQISMEDRITEQYRSYLSELIGYLEGFYRRSKPLCSLEKIYKKTETDFDLQWQKGQVAGWENLRKHLEQTSRYYVNNERPIDLRTFSGSEEVQDLGCDKIDEALQSMGLKRGENLKEKAERLWETRDKPLKQLKKGIFTKLTRLWLANDLSEQVFKSIALRELKLKRISWELRDVIENTVEKIENMLTRTFEEMESDRKENVVDTTDREEHEDEYLYNPLKLPLGPDGKPIPYWLYKLHGLNKKNPCEICGNFVYEGRRAFEKHFREPRHQQGMHALGIPNTKIFFEITKIGDAVELWKSLETKQLQKRGRASALQEYEDAEGNVYDRETYMLVKKQGII